MALSTGLLWLSVQGGCALSARHVGRHRHSRTAPRAAAEAQVVDRSELSTLLDKIADLGAKDLSLISTLDDLRDEKFCSLYSMDLLASCAYIGGSPDECEFDACEVLSEEPSPSFLLARDSDERAFELDAWCRMEPPSEDYYDLGKYPEGYTKYNGSHVWAFIYDNLAFSGVNSDARGQCGFDDPDGWRRVFDRAVSGVHASIATHIADDFEDEETCRAEFARRVGDHPDRVANVEFVFALLLTALRESRSSLADYDFDIGECGDTDRMKMLVNSLIKEEILEAPEIAKTARLLREYAAEASECEIISDDFSGDEWLEEAGLWQMRSVPPPPAKSAMRMSAPAKDAAPVRQRSRAMLRVMDCIQCGVCRLHGKIAWFGVATALRLIYSNPKSKPLSRAEVGALLTASAKLATAVRFIDEMGAMRNRDE